MSGLSPLLHAINRTSDYHQVQVRFTARRYAVSQPRTHSRKSVCNGPGNAQSVTFWRETTIGFEAAFANAIQYAVLVDVAHALSKFRARAV
jgi:hypothetical protein